MSRSNRLRENTRAAQRLLVLAVMGVMLSAGVAWLLLLHNSSHPKAHWSVLAQDALESGEIAKALKILQTNFQDSPDDVELLRKLSDLEFVIGRYEKSLHHFLQLAEQNPSMAAIFRMRAAHCTLKLDRLDETVTHLQEALRLNPQLADARRMLIIFYENLFLLREMREQIVLLDVNDQATAEDVVMFCSGDRLLYDTKENISQLEKLIKQDPDNVVITAALAQNLIRTYQYERVRKLVNELHSQTKSENRWRLTLVLIEEMFNSKKYAEAAEQLEKLPPAADRVPRTWIVRGRTARELGETTKAVIAFRNAATLDRFDPEPWYALSQIHLSTGKKAEGNRELEHSNELQQLTTLIEYALTLEEAEVPSYILQISRLLLDLEESRASQICLEWLISENWKTEEAVHQLRELKKRTRDPANPDCGQRRQSGGFRVVNLHTI